MQINFVVIYRILLLNKGKNFDAMICFEWGGDT